MKPIDEASVQQVLGGDTEAFRTLVERHSRAVFRLAYRMTGNEQEAEDLVQETFLRAYTRLELFELQSNFGTWLYRIATNLALDRIRSKRRRGERQMPVMPDNRDFADSIPAGDPLQDRLVYSGEMRERVTKALSLLTVQERAAFVLRHFEERPVKEVGQILGLRENATKQSILRAIKKIKRALRPAMASR